MRGDNLNGQGPGQSKGQRSGPDMILPGQAYVALSRAEGTKYLTISDLDLKSFIADPTVVQWYNDLDRIQTTIIGDVICNQESCEPTPIDGILEIVLQIGKRYAPSYFGAQEPLMSCDTPKRDVTSGSLWASNNCVGYEHWTSADFAAACQPLPVSEVKEQFSLLHQVRLDETATILLI